MTSELIVTANRPQIPTTPWTDIAPTGSSIRSLSKKETDNTTIAPPMAPIRVAIPPVADSGSAVIATRPANAPLTAIVRSALPNSRCPRTNAARRPPAAAALVLTNTLATLLADSTLDTANSEPPLKPNQPIHRMNIPIAASGMLAPGIAFTLPSALYLPLRGPRNRTPDRAAVAPQRCTIPEPA